MLLQGREVFVSENKTNPSGEVPEPMPWGQPGFAVPEHPARRARWQIPYSWPAQGRASPPQLRYLGRERPRHKFFPREREASPGNEALARHGRCCCRGRGLSSPSELRCVASAHGTVTAAVPNTKKHKELQALSLMCCCTSVCSVIELLCVVNRPCSGQRPQSR